MEIKKLAFLETLVNDDSTIMGAIMVTDSDTKPIEFRVTSPVNPTSFQKILYGEVLNEHILVELIALPLLNAINEELDIILVNNPLFLGTNSKQDIRVVRAFSENQAEAGSNDKIELKSSNGKTGSTFLSTSKNLVDELPGISEALGGLADYRDLLEPFERLKAACEQVHLKKTKE